MKMGPEIQYSWSCIDQNKKDVNTFEEEIKGCRYVVFSFPFARLLVVTKNLLVLAC